MVKKGIVAAGLVSMVALAVLLPVALVLAQAQEPTEAWVARYNGPGNGNDYTEAIAVDSSGNVYVTGASQGSGSQYDYATIKYDSDGDEQWVRRYNGPDYDNDFANAIAVDSSGNVYVTGTSHGSDSQLDYATIKYDGAGVEQWVRRYNGPGNDNDYATAIAIDSSGNVYITGYGWGSETGEDYATIKYDNKGVEQWVCRYNGPGNWSDEAKDIALDGLDNVYVTGQSADLNKTYDYATVKYGRNGNQLWVARYNGPYNGNDRAHAIAVDGAGNVYVTGDSTATILDDYATVKYDGNGNQLWATQYDGHGLYSGDVAEDIAIDGRGNVYVTGSSPGLDDQFDYTTIKYDRAGVEQWVGRYSGPGSGGSASAIAIDSSDNVCVTGTNDGGLSFNYDYATIKYDGAGVEQWVTRYNGPASLDDSANAIFVDGSGNIYVTGCSSGDYATIKYSPLAPPRTATRLIFIIGASLLVIAAIVALALIFRRRPTRGSG